LIRYYLLGLLETADFLFFGKKPLDYIPHFESISLLNGLKIGIILLKKSHTHLLGVPFFFLGELTYDQG